MMLNNVTNLEAAILEDKILPSSFVMLLLVYQASLVGLFWKETREIY